MKFPEERDVASTAARVLKIKNDRTWARCAFRGPARDERGWREERGKGGKRAENPVYSRVAAVEMS